MKTAILINYKDRPTELALLLQSIRTQTYQDFDIYILDDFSGTPLNNYHFLNCLMPRMILENHSVQYRRTDFVHGVSRARQTIVDWALESDYDYFIRVDDDCILQPDYIERLIKVAENYDICTGVTITFGPCLKRDPKFLKGVINRIILNEQGDFIFNGDDCGMPYIKSEILPAHHFRSCALIKRKVHEKIKYYPTKLSLNGYREELLFSLKAIIEGFTIGCDTQAVNFHMATPSGGERPTMSLAPFNQQMVCEYVKEHKDQIIPITSKKEELDPLEYFKENNLLR